MYFLTDNLLNYNLSLCKSLIKLKALFHYNFKTFDQIEISLRKNTSFISLFLEKLQMDDEQS